MIKRRDFITLLGGAATAWPIAARAQQPAVPVVALIEVGSPNRRVNSARSAAFQRGLNETGYVDGKNVTVEFQWLRMIRPIRRKPMFAIGRRHFISLCDGAAAAWPAH